MSGVPPSAPHLALFRGVAPVLQPPPGSKVAPMAATGVVMQPPAGYVPPAGAKKPQAGGGGSKNGVRLFVGGLPPEAEDSDIKEYFSKFGELTESQVIRDRATGKSRNFGFVGIADVSRE
ncbi:unnamed protein product, partial [Prorocentrum cordatum]